MAEPESGLSKLVRFVRGVADVGSGPGVPAMFALQEDGEANIIVIPSDPDENDGRLREILSVADGPRCLLLPLDAEPVYVIYGENIDADGVVERETWHRTEDGPWEKSARSNSPLP